MGIDYKNYFEHGIDYAQYFDNMKLEIENKVESEYSKFLPINFQRSKRLAKTIHLSEELVAKLFGLKNQFNWLVISEHWCGDSAQILPIIQAIAGASNGKINLRIIYRDQNLPLMNAHLTNGGMSIPKLIILDANFHLLSEWGPRPLEAQELVANLKGNPETASNYSEFLHKWYADDKTNSIQSELLTLFNS